MNTILSNTESRMKAAFEHLFQAYAAIRAGRANTSILDKITVDYYGTQTPINQIAAVSVMESRVISIQPWDISMINAIEKAIQKSDIGINPQNDGKSIKLIFPPLTEDRRKEIVKEVSRLAEEEKVSVRNIRRDALAKIKALKKNSEITEDESKSAEKKIQTLTDDMCSQLENLCKIKTEQTMKI